MNVTFPGLRDDDGMTTSWIEEIAMRLIALNIWHENAIELSHYGTPNGPMRQVDYLQPTIRRRRQVITRVHMSFVLLLITILSRCRDPLIEHSESLLQPNSSELSQQVCRELTLGLSVGTRWPAP